MIIRDKSWRQNNRDKKNSQNGTTIEEKKIRWLHRSHRIDNDMLSLFSSLCLPHHSSSSARVKFSMKIHIVITKLYHFPFSIIEFDVICVPQLKWIYLYTHIYKHIFNKRQIHWGIFAIESIFLIRISSVLKFRKLIKE